jgi:Carboxypeptidase regulatory-like domain
MSRVIIGCVLTLMYISSLSADQQSVITGRVTDSEGAAIAKARVLVHWDSSGGEVGLTGNTGTTQDVSVLTDASGAYSAGVPAGFYDVFVSAPAFTPSAAKVIVKQGQRATLSVKLRVDPLVSKELGGMRVYPAPKKR